MAKSGMISPYTNCASVNPLTAPFVWNYYTHSISKLNPKTTTGMNEMYMVEQTNLKSHIKTFKWKCSFKVGIFPEKL